MPSDNDIRIIGHMTRNPELKYSQSGVPVARFGVAVNRYAKDAEGHEEVDFFEVSCFRKTAEFVHEYLAKGRCVLVKGRMESRHFTGEDNVKRTYWGVVANEVKFMDSKPQTGEGESAGDAAPKAERAAPARPPQMTGREKAAAAAVKTRGPVAVADPDDNPLAGEADPFADE